MNSGSHCSVALAGLGTWLCSGADLARRLSVDFGLPVIDGVAAAVKQVEGLVAQGLKTSKMGSYAMPPRKDYVGQFADDQPQP